MRVAIYGAGSLGTVLGAYMEKAGKGAELFNRNREHVAALRAHGATLCGTVELTAPVQAFLPEEMQGAYDCIFLMTKQQQNEQVARFLAPHLKEDGVLVTMQNGLPEPGLSAILGEGRVLGCTVGWGATLLSPGVVQVTSAPDAMHMVLGSIYAGNEKQIARVEPLLACMCPIEVEEAFLGMRWAKLLINAVFSGTATVLGCTFGEVAGDAALREIALRVLLETLDAAEAAGVQMGLVQGINIAKLLRKRSAFGLWATKRIMPIAMKKHRDIRPSMLQDIENGKPTEVAFINGVVSEHGKKHGVPTPVNDAIVRLVREIEAGERQPCKGNAELLLQF